MYRYSKGKCCRTGRGDLDRLQFNTERFPYVGDGIQTVTSYPDTTRPIISPPMLTSFDMSTHVRHK